MGNKTAVVRLEVCESGSKMGATAGVRTEEASNSLNLWSRRLESNHRPAVYELLAKTAHRQKSRVNRVDDVDRNGPYKVSCPQPRNPGATDFTKLPPWHTRKNSPSHHVGMRLKRQAGFSAVSIYGLTELRRNTPL